MAGRGRRAERPLRDRIEGTWNPGGRTALQVLVSGGDDRAPAAHRERDAREPLPRLRRGQARAARLLPQLQRGVLGSRSLVGHAAGARRETLAQRRLARGRSTQKVAPLRGSDQTPTRPRRDSTIRFTVASPSPMPGTRVPGARTYGANTACSIPAGRPGP